jgi:hypothetical protein
MMILVEFRLEDASPEVERSLHADEKSKNLVGPSRKDWVMRVQCWARV